MKTLPETTEAASFHMLDRAECFGLLSSSTVGRIAFVVDSRVVLLPINYLVVDDVIVMRTSSTGTLSHLLDLTGEAVLEVDHHSPAAVEGWSVVVRGRATQVTDLTGPSPSELARLVPWAVGDTPVVVALHPERVTGRRVGMGSADVAGR